MMYELKQNQTNKGKGMGRHSKGIRYFGLSGKGKRPCRKDGKTKIAPCNTSRKNQAPHSTIGIQ